MVHFGSSLVKLSLNGCRSLISIRLPLLGSWESAEAHPNCLQGKVRGHRSITHRRNRHTHSHSLNLDEQVNFILMFMDCGKKLGYPEKIHTSTGRASKLHTERCCDATYFVASLFCPKAFKNVAHFEEC